MAGMFTTGREPTSREASQAMLEREERAAYNDAAVAAAGGGVTSGASSFGDPGDRAAYEGRMAVKRRRKMREANITPEDEKALHLAMEHAGGKSMWNYGPGFQRYRSRAAMDDLAMRRTRSGGDPEARIDPKAWSLPENIRL